MKKGNSSSMLLESSRSEVENRKDEIHLPRVRFSFSKIWTVQIEENGSSLKVKELSLRDSPFQMQLFSSSMDLFLMLFKRLNA